VGGELTVGKEALGIGSGARAGAAFPAIGKGS